MRILKRIRSAGLADRGATSVMAMPVIVAVVALSLILILMLGSATSDDRETDAAADAAALAAAGEWRDVLLEKFKNASVLGTEEAFWAFLGTDLSSTVPASAKTAARQFAARNGAQLKGFSVDTKTMSIKVAVRHTEKVNNTDTRATATATSRLVFDGGFCRAGSEMGFKIGGKCVTKPPPKPSTPIPPGSVGAPDPSPEPSPTPTFTPPNGFSTATIAVRLVHR